jgi:thiamine-phosphate pyrophosphorylase
LHAILDVDAAGAAGWAPLALAGRFLDGGATVVQLRAKRLASGPLLDLADALVALGQPYAAHVIVNDRVDVAVLSHAAGAHVGQDDLPPADARAQLGPHAILGLSTHDTEQFDRALRQPATYIAVGPVFGTRTKDTGYAPVGLDLVRAARARARGVPIVAIGGITLETAPSVLEAGATAVAVIGDLLATGDPRARVEQYVRKLARLRLGPSV